MIGNIMILKNFKNKIEVVKGTTWNWVKIIPMPTYWKTGNWNPWSAVYSKLICIGYYMIAVKKT